MRKRIQLLLILLTGILANAQDNSIASSVLTPVAYQTGVPDISFPLVSLPAAKDFTLNFGLVYNPNSYVAGEFSGQIARNWMLSGSNFMITRRVTDSWPDEIEEKEYWNDIYYYNLNGEQGSFKFEKTGVFPNDIYNIIKLTPNNIKIECERIVTTSGWEPKPVKSFTITDSKGYKYYFMDYDYQKLPYYGQGNGTPNVDMRNTFYVTSIKDSHGNLIAEFQNKKYIKYEDHSSTVQNAWYFIPEKAKTNYGTIIFGQGDSGINYRDLDRYFISSITLKDHKDNFISKSELDINSSLYSYKYLLDGATDPTTIYTRTLMGIKKSDKNSHILENTKFSYTPSSLNGQPLNGSIVGFPGITSPNIFGGILKDITFSSGKKIEYEFSDNKTKNNLDMNSPDYIAFIQDPNQPIRDFDICFLRGIGSIQIDTKITKKYPITGLIHSPFTRIYVNFERNEYYPAGPANNPTLSGPGGGDLPEIFTYILKSTTINNGFETENQYAEYVIPADGSAYLEILGSGGKGTFTLYEKDYFPPPYINKDKMGVGTRIDKIKYYDKAENFYPDNPFNSYDLKKTTSFDYSFFDEPGFSSGKVVQDAQKEAIIYKNVKVTESDKPGYTKYYFTTALDYPGYISNNENVWPNFNLTKKGLLDKKEIYNINDVKQRSTVYDYTFPPYDETKQYKYELTSSVDYIYTQESFPLKISTTETTYDSGGNAMVETSEKSFNQDNDNLMSEKHTSSDGIISETVYQYAAEKGNSKLLGANMFSVPLEVTRKQNNIQIGKLETRYDQAGNYFPSSVTSFGINNVITGEQTNNYYDAMGNVLQTTSKSGVPTAIIWGYGNTQPIAKIEGGEYYNILAVMGQADAGNLDIVQKSNQDTDSTDNTNEQALRNALETFRKKPEFKNYRITTYTYDPLIGVKSVTSPNGFTEYYFYDNQNRLVRVEDTNHNVIKENKYQQTITN